MKILLVNGYQKHEFCKGKLNFSLYNIMLDKLRHNHDVQFPIYWFNVPGKLKLYMDEVFEYGQFYSFADTYGQGGLMKNKEYILSTTWNAPEEVFNNPAAFFDGKNVDDVLISFHKTMEFCGLKKRKTLSFHNVVKNPQFKFYKQTIEDYFLK